MFVWQLFFFLCWVIIRPVIVIIIKKVELLYVCICVCVFIFVVVVDDVIPFRLLIDEQPLKDVYITIFNLIMDVTTWR